ncbi:hypothetical protein M569_14730 [Genlisea aurea]|uniref:GH16 domain-containing protein n=1 Tax=Genlisea aurea TaxID=192259 RepID=S8DBH0_9LAMI|nr:hypothetical protein M569_14730 [Genlisea aurea]
MGIRILAVTVLFFLTYGALADDFYSYYSPLWGLNHITLNPQATEVHLLMDKSSGAGFRSKSHYGSGIFRIDMQISERKTKGIVTSFYLTSAPDNQDPGNHFELDFEFLGTTGVVQTNVYDNDGGHREQSFKLPFDPSQGFHRYEILWNPTHIVFRIDGVPVREFRNIAGVAYPSLPMQIEASIWDADWAGVVDWSQAPFVSKYSNFHLYGCESQGSSIRNCGSQGYFWNSFNKLTAAERYQMMEYRRRYMSYDYCSNPNSRKPECSFNNYD